MTTPLPTRVQLSGDSKTLLCGHQKEDVKWDGDTAFCALCRNIVEASVAPPPDKGEQDLESYLHRYIRNQVIDFSLRAQVMSDGSVSFYIHPANVDGQTLDFYIEGNTVSLRRVTGASVASPQGKLPEYHEGYVDGLSDADAYLRKQVAELEAKLAQASVAEQPTPPSEAQELRESLQEILTLIENGTLVRDCSEDDNPDWVMKQIPLVQALARASRALKSGAGRSEGEV